MNPKDHFIHKYNKNLSLKIGTKFTNAPNACNKEKGKAKWVKLPYMGDTSSKIFNKLNCNIGFSHTNSLRKILMKKNKSEIKDKTGVYGLICEDCNSTYIG